MAGQQGEIRTGPQTIFQLRRLPVRFEKGQGQTHLKAMADPTDKSKRSHDRSGMPGPEANVPDRVTDSYREASASRLARHETYTMAFVKQLEGPGITRKGDPHPKSLVAGGRQCTQR